MYDYIKYRFKHPNTNIKYEYLYNEGVKELEDMNYYHSIREIKEQKLKESENLLKQKTSEIILKNYSDKDIHSQKNNNIENNNNNPSIMVENDKIKIFIEEYFLKLSDSVLTSLSISKRVSNKSNMKKLLTYHKLSFTTKDSLETLESKLYRYLNLNTQK